MNAVLSALLAMTHCCEQWSLAPHRVRKWFAWFDATAVCNMQSDQRGKGDKIPGILHALNHLCDSLLWTMEFDNLTGMRKLYSRFVTAAVWWLRDHHMERDGEMI